MQQLRWIWSSPTPFGNNVQYAELADFFHVWLRIALRDKYPQLQLDLTPKSLEAVDNPFVTRITLRAITNNCSLLFGANALGF